MNIDFEEAPLPPGYACLHGVKAPDPLEAGTVIAIGNCGLYCGSWGVRVEDTVVVAADGRQILTQVRKELVELD